MPILRDFERRLGGLVEGFFATTFRSGLQPVELAKRMMREMDASKTVGVKEVWAPEPPRVHPRPRSDAPAVLSVAEQALVGEPQAGRDARPPPNAGGVCVDPRGGSSRSIRARQGRFGCEASFVEGEEEPRCRSPPWASGVRWSALADGVSTALAKPSVTIGRLPNATWSWTDAGVSRQHARIRRTDGGFVLTDLGSTNGTMVNGEPHPGARPRTRRPHHDRRDRARVPERLSVSPFVLSVLKHSLLVLLYFFVFRAIRSVAVDVGGRKRGATTQMRTPAPASTAKPSKGGRAPTQVVVTTPAVGSPSRSSSGTRSRSAAATDVRFCLQDTYVSQVHARLYGKDGAWYVDDQGSTNGTLLNDRRVDAPVEVHAGDVVKVGKTVLELKR